MDHTTASLESIQAVHADLLALSDSRLLNIERLGDQLIAHIIEFRGLLDKKSRSDQSRQKLGTGMYCTETVLQRPEARDKVLANQNFQASLISKNATLSTTNSNRRLCK